MAAHVGRMFVGAAARARLRDPYETAAPPLYTRGFGKSSPTRPRRPSNMLILAGLAILCGCVSISSRVFAPRRAPPPADNDSERGSRIPVPTSLVSIGALRSPPNKADQMPTQTPRCIADVYRQGSKQSSSSLSASAVSAVHGEDPWHRRHCPAPSAVRFVILSKQHSGTHFFRDVMHHPEHGATVLGELFFERVNYCNVSGSSMHAKLDKLFGFVPLDDDESFAPTNCVHDYQWKPWMEENKELLKTRYGDDDAKSDADGAVDNPNHLLTRFLQNQDYIGFIWQCTWWDLPNFESTQDNPYERNSSQYADWQAARDNATIKQEESRWQTVYNETSSKCNGELRLSPEHVDYLKTRQVRVVLLERTNEIASSLAGDATDAIKFTEGTAEAGITVDVSNLEQNAHQRQTMFASQYDDFVSAGIPTLHVTYEALNRNHSSYADVLRFLGMQNVSIKTHAGDFAGKHTVITPRWSKFVSDNSKHHKHDPIDYIANVPAVMKQIPKMKHVEKCMLWDNCTISLVKHA